MKIIKIILFAAIFVQLGYFVYVESTVVVVTRPVIENDGLADALKGLRVAHITDLHVHKIGAREKHLAAAVERVDPDLLLITGDFVSSNEGISPCAVLARQLAKNRTVIAVLGNNDHSYRRSTVDTDLLVKELRAAGVRLLMNESVRVEAGGEDIYVAGTDDNFSMHDDYYKAMNNVPGGAPKILLAHAPNIVDKIPDGGIDLVLSGHTHGGQITIPFYGALYTNPPFRAQKKYVSGLYNEETKLYVNRGIGTVLVPFRLFCRPELTVFDFREK